jgi:hypothetical protein
MSTTNVVSPWPFAVATSANQNWTTASKIDLAEPATRENAVPAPQHVLVPGGGYAITVAPDFDDPLKF